MFIVLVVLFMKNKSRQELSHSVKCSFCVVSSDQSDCCQMGVHIRSALMRSPCRHRCPRDLNLHPEQSKGSHAELFRYESLTAG